MVFKNLIASSIASLCSCSISHSVPITNRSCAPSGISHNCTSFPSIPRILSTYRSVSPCRTSAVPTCTHIGTLVPNGWSKGLIHSLLRSMPSGVKLSAAHFKSAVGKLSTPALRLRSVMTPSGVRSSQGECRSRARGSGRPDSGWSWR